MPKVGTVEFIIKGKPQKFDLMYSRKEGFSLKNFPSDITDIVSSRNIQFHNTEAELVSYYNGAIREYHQLIEKNTKVILYALYLPTEKIMNRIGYGHYQGHQNWIPNNMSRKIESMNGDGFGFQLEYRVVVRVENNFTKYYEIKEAQFDGDEHEDELRRETHKKQNEFEIEWTPQREAFFTSMEAQVDEMIKKMVSFFAKDEKQLLQIFDAGGIKLLGNPNQP